MNQVNQRPWNCCWGLLWILCSPRAGNCWIPLLFRPCTPLRFGKDCKKNKKQKTEKLYCFKTNKKYPQCKSPIWWEEKWWFACVWRLDNQMLFGKLTCTPDLPGWRKSSLAWTLLSSSHLWFSKQAYLQKPQGVWGILFISEYNKLFLKPQAFSDGIRNGKHRIKAAVV